jgi:hypothetical protein
MEKRKYAFTTGYGRWTTHHEVTVECREQRGKFYASVNTLNPTYAKLGIGGTEEQAFEEWRKIYNARRIKTTS